MYSGTTFRKSSGKYVGVHQKIDRLARRNLTLLDKSLYFPRSKDIIHFEGYNGPDAIKRKSPAKNEPWHFMSPYDLDDTQLLTLIENHYNNLVKALKAKNRERSSFEAAWLSHAIVDGLTPAHQYPYEEKLEELRNGQTKETRDTFKNRLIMSGDKKRHVLHNNWKMWGPKGLFITHAAFEIGVAGIMVPLSFPKSVPNKKDIEQFSEGIDKWYRKIAQDIASHGLYDEFYEYGWTMSLSAKIRKYLAPLLIKTVSVAWYNASLDAKK